MKVIEVNVKSACSIYGHLPYLLEFLSGGSEHPRLLVVLSCSNNVISCLKYSYLIKFVSFSCLASLRRSNCCSQIISSNNSLNLNIWSDFHNRMLYNDCSLLAWSISIDWFLLKREILHFIFIWVEYFVL